MIKVRTDMHSPQLAAPLFVAGRSNARQLDCDPNPRGQLLDGTKERITSRGTATDLFSK
jgi:hypothetical protein